MVSRTETKVEIREYIRTTIPKNRLISGIDSQPLSYYPTPAF